jgi:hypothetical protein
MRLILFLLLFLAPSAFPQTAPDYFVGAGGSTGSAVQGWVTFGARLASVNVLSLTTIEIGGPSVLRTGFATVLKTSGRMSLIALADAGATPVPPVNGSFSGGGILTYDVRGVTAIAGIRVESVGSSVSPVFYFGIGRKF